jgi:hypothetical protein
MPLWNHAFIAVVARGCQRTLYWARVIEFKYDHSSSLTSTLILSSQLRLCFPSSLVPSGFPTKLCKHLWSLPCVLYTLTISSSLVLQSLWYLVPSVRNFFQPPVTSSPYRKKIFFTVSCSQFLSNPRYSPIVKDQNLDAKNQRVKYSFPYFNFNASRQKTRT